MSQNGDPVGSRPPHLHILSLQIAEQTKAILKRSYDLLRETAPLVGPNSMIIPKRDCNDDSAAE